VGPETGLKDAGPCLTMIFRVLRFYGYPNKGKTTENTEKYRKNTEQEAFLRVKNEPFACQRAFRTLNRGENNATDETGRQ